MNREPHRTLLSARPGSGLRRLRWCLRCALALQCAAAAHIALAYYTPVNSWLLMARGKPPEFGTLVDRTAAAGLILGGASALFRPARPALILLSVWFVALAFATWANDPRPTAYLAPVSQALRALAPIALLLLLRGRFVGSGVWLLRLAASATFAGHGMQALEQYPAFIDMILGTTRRCFGWSMAEDTARALLVTFGIVDLMLAVLILIRPLRSVAAYMALWGLATALARMGERGLDAWPDTLLRAVHVLGPLGLFLHWTSAEYSRSQPHGAPHA